MNIARVGIILCLLHGGHQVEAQTTRAADGGSESATSIALKMIHANEEIANVRGKFRIVERTWYTDQQLEELRNQYKDYDLKGLSPKNTAKVSRMMLIRFAGIKTKGFEERVDFFRGLYDRNGRFDVELSNPPDARSLDPIDRRFAYDGTLGLIYFLESDTAIISPRFGGDPMFPLTAQQLDPVRRWLSVPNQIVSKEKVSLVSRGTYGNKDTVVIRQGPTPFTVGSFEIESTVVPALGYVSVLTRFIRVADEFVGRTFANEDFIEVMPGRWVPKRTTESLYEERPLRRLARQNILIFDDTPTINVALTAKAFDVSTPKSARHIVDQTKRGKDGGPATTEPAVAGGINRVVRALQSPAMVPAFASIVQTRQRASWNSFSIAIVTLIVLGVLVTLFAVSLVLRRRVKRRQESV